MNSLLVSRSMFKTHTVDLFNQNNFAFKKSSNTVLLQLADFIGGTINRFSASKSDIDVKSLLPNKILGEVKWPENYKPFTVEKVEVHDEFEEVISDLALLRIQKYLSISTAQLLPFPFRAVSMSPVRQQLLLKLTRRPLLIPPVHFLILILIHIIIFI